MRGSMQWLGLLLLVAVLLQTVAVAISFLYFSGVLNSMKETFSKTSISCLMRANLRPVKSLDAAGGKDDPCWPVAQQLHFLVEKHLNCWHCFYLAGVNAEEVSRVLPSLMTQEGDSALKPEIAAHVTGGSLDTLASAQSPPNRKVQGQKIPAWESARGLAFLHNMELQDGELVIPQSGLYYIYSQTYFRHSQPEEGEGGEQKNEPTGKHMLQYIYKKVSSYPAPILLMKNAQTTCWSRDAEYGLYSIYQAGVVQLGVGDRLFVTVSNLSTVDMDEKSSFFGAFLVS
ncbi:tumor necrosis factor ligand superfamily member 10 isoform X1 [Arapaima gigas]